MPRIKKRQPYWTGKQEEKGRLQAQVEAQRKKPLDVSLKEHVGKILDNTKLMEIAELAAVIGFTITIHGVMDEHKEWRAKARAMRTEFWSFLSAGVISQLPAGTLPTEPTVQEDLMDWLIDFSLAFVIVKYGGQLLGLLGSGLEKVLPMLLGIVAA